ncbi:glycosyltransferase family 2 protein [Actinophytocola sp.]|uniref:glycosyltransferase family 2 protein n=1 Tax=Actinophytocola sp. TaxID=1872138 RepID=UPI002ED3480E
MTVVMTLLVRDEADIVAAVVEHHLAAGVDLVVATDNGSVDGTVDILAAYEKAGVVELHHEPGRDYRQGEWVTRMARRAARVHGADWVINADADEFLWTDVPLPDVFAAVTGDGMTVPRDNLVADPAATGSWPDRLVLRDELSLSPRGTRIGPKFCHIGDPDVTVAYGNHTATGPRLRPPFAAPGEHPLRMLHVPDRGFQQYARKIANGGSAYAANTEVGAEVGWHWREDYERQNAGTFAEVYASRQRTARDVERQLALGELVHDTRLRDRLHALVPTAVLPDRLSEVLG